MDHTELVWLGRCQAARLNVCDALERLRADISVLEHLRRGMGEKVLKVIDSLDSLDTDLRILQLERPK
jgi:hypothetical protein